MSWWGIVIGFVLLVVTWLLIKFANKSPVGAILVAVVFTSLVCGVIAIINYEKLDNFSRYVGAIFLFNLLAMILAFVSSLLINEFSRYHWEDICHNVYGVIYFVCIIVSFMVMNNHVSNIVSIEMPEIIINRYELLESDELTSGEDEHSKLIYNVDKGYYEFFYQSEDENGVAVIETYTVDSDDVKVTIQPVMEKADCDYLLEVVTRYYTEDRNKEPYGRTVTSEETEKTLYLRKNTFDNMIVVGGSD